MLTEIRDRSSGVFAWVIAALIIIPMAFWGVQEYASTEAQPTIIEVGDQKITQQAFQLQLANEQSRAAQENPELASSEFFNSDLFKRQVLQNMISRSLVEDLAAQHNYRIGDKQLAELIKQSPVFQIDGKFDKTVYETYAASQGYSKTQFEQNARSSNRIAQVASGYQQSALVLPDEVRELLEIQAEQRTFDLIKINKNDFIDSVQVSEQDIAAYYADNQEQFMFDDRMSISYVELSLDDIAATITVDPAELEEIYQDNIDSYISPETRSASHILLSTSGDQDEDEQLAKAKALIGQLNDGTDFAELAKENSQDPGSAANGGSLGAISRGEMVPEFEDAAFNLELGEISAPVRSQFGYHIIKIDSIDGGVAQEFDEVKFDIEQEERERLAEEELLLRVEQLRNIVFEQPNSLEPAAQELGLEIRSSDLFTNASGDGIASNDVVRNTAFSEQVAVDGLNSEPFEVAGGVYVALRKLDFSAAAAKPLETVAAQIKATLTNQRASDAAKAAGDSVLSKAENNWSALSEDESLSVATHTVSMLENTDNVAADVMREVITAQLDGGSPKVISFTGSNGDFNIVRLTAVTAGNIAAVSEQVKESTRQLLAQRNGQALFDSYIRSLGAEYQNEINQDLL